MPLKLVPPRPGKTPYWSVRGTYLGRYINRSTKTRSRSRGDSNIFSATLALQTRFAIPRCRRSLSKTSGAEISGRADGSACGDAAGHSPRRKESRDRQMGHTREAAALAKNRFAAKAGRAARERLAYSHLVVPSALPPLPCPSCQRWGAAFRPDPRCACVLSLAGLQSLLSWATLLRTRDARVVIKREKVPKGFRPVRDRSREVFRWGVSQQQTKNEWVRLLTHLRAIEQPSNHTTLQRVELSSLHERRRPLTIQTTDRLDFAALVCGITMSDTSFGITYGRKD
jgi:hypothetical protein